MNLKTLRYTFNNTKTFLHFNKPDDFYNDTNTYTLLLGENGVGKSMLFESILHYYSSEYRNSKLDEVSVSLDGKISNIILSAYSPYDRIRSRKNELSNKIDFYNKVKIVYPNYNFSDLVTIASASYFKGKLIRDEKSTKLNDYLSKIINYDTNEEYLLIETINQMKPETLITIANRAFNNDSVKFKKLVSMRKKLLPDVILNELNKLDELLKRRKSLLDRISIFDFEHEIRNSSIFMDYELEEKLEKKIKFSLGVQKEININNKYWEEIKKINKIINKIAHNISDYKIIKNHLKHIKSIRNLAVLELYLIFLDIKYDYIRIKQEYGVVMTHENKNKKLLTIESLTLYFKDKYSTNYTSDFSDYFDYNERDLYSNEIIKYIELDYEILEIMGIYLIDELFFKKQNEEYYVGLSQFSSGEFALFSRLYSINLNIEQNSLVLIDEPEVHLNPDWINKYFYLLSKVFENMDCHFIIASQSPVIVGMLKKEQVFYFEKLERINKEIGREIKTIKTETFLSNYNDILNNVFNVNYDNNKIINNRISTLKEKIENKDSIEEFWTALEEVSSLAESKQKFHLVDELLTEEKLQQIEKFLIQGD